MVSSDKVGVQSLAMVWIIVVVAAQLQPTSVAQDSTPQSNPFTAPCSEMRDKLEDEFYVMYKGRLPRRMLKDLLPLFVEPLLDPSCASVGYAARLKAPAPPAQPAPPPKGTAKRVKRASEEESSSDHSYTDVVTFGDVTMPKDTFHKMISPPEEPVRPRLWYPPPVYYHPPLVYPHNGNGGYYGHNGNGGHYHRQNGNGYYRQNNGGNGYYPQNNGYHYAHNGYGNGFVPGTNGLPFPMGAAKYIGYGDYPLYGY